MRVVRSASLDVYANLALEDLLLDQADELSPLLFLWRAESAIVIGKNQNPWRECDWATVAREGGRLARRISGGGAVYHDHGNLNYAWVCARTTYRAQSVFDAVLRGLRRVGVVAERLGKSGLGVGGSKISGTAFCFRKNAVLHHGTLLVTARLDRLHRWLNSPVAVMETRAVASEPSPVVNLGTYGVNREMLEEALIASFARLSDEPAVDPVPVWRFDVAARRRRFEAWEWVFGHTPAFACRIGELTMDVEKGRVVAVAGNPDRQHLVGRRFDDALRDG